MGVSECINNLILILWEGLFRTVRMLDVQKKTYSMAHSNLPTIEKINHIRLINKDISVDELSSILKLNKSIIYGHIRTLKSRGTLLCA